MKTLLPDAWPIHAFHDVDDRVRGGSSTSQLSVTKSDDGTRTVFSGHLDTKTLGGAGFASQVTSSLPKLPATLQGLQFTVYPAASSSLKAPTNFVLTLKTDKPERRPDGRLESRVSFEYRFRAPQDAPVTIEAYWHEFEATYRGKPVARKDAPRLDMANLEEFGIMCRSFFDEQSGDFSVSLGKVEAFERSDASWRSWFRSWISWLL